MILDYERKAFLNIIKKIKFQELLVDHEGQVKKFDMRYPNPVVIKHLFNH